MSAAYDSHIDQSEVVNVAPFTYNIDLRLQLSVSSFVHRDKPNFKYMKRISLSPRFSKKKRGICVTVRRPSVRLSVRPSVRQQFTSISSYTIDARITPISLCIQMVATYLKFFYYFQFLNNSDFSDFTQKCNFSGNLSRNLFKFLSVWGMSYTSYIKQVLSCDFQITPENGNIDGGGGF